MTTDSTLPPQAAFHHAVLRHLARCPDGDRRQHIHEAIPDLLGLSEAQRTERLANLPHLRYRHRSGWALLARYPDGFDEETGRRVIREGRNEGQGQDIVGGGIAQAPPPFFEGLVLDLLHALGYGASDEDLERVGHSGDGGIDGVISLDKLGFERVYVQAKRWQGSVGRPEVQAFYGALAGRRARKGVFITTSSFTREAREFASQVAESIILIDGARLTSLMIEHGVGVSHYRVLRLPKVDDDCFDAD